MIAGIDFSVNSTALVIQNNEETRYFVFVPNYQVGRAAFRIHEALSHVVQTCSYEKSARLKGCQSWQEERKKLENAHCLSDAIVNVMNGFSETEPFESIRIEGYSFGSQGNAFIDLVTFNTFLKVKLLQSFGNILYIIPPKSVKKVYSGNGNASKHDMLQAFMRKEPSSLLADAITKNFPGWRDPLVKIPKPLDDVIDAVALLSVDL